MVHMNTRQLLYMYLCRIVPGSTQKGPSWKANSCSASQEITRISWKPKVHYRGHNSPPLIPVPSQMKSVHTFPPNFSNIDFNIILLQWTGFTDTPNIPCSKHHVYFPLPRSFRTIRPSPKPAVSFRNVIVFRDRICQPPAQPPLWRTTPCWLLVIAYFTCS
jgi:hypothetical protein